MGENKSYLELLNSFLEHWNTSWKKPQQGGRSDIADRYADETFFLGGNRHMAHPNPRFVGASGSYQGIDDYLSITESCRVEPWNAKIISDHLHLPDEINRGLHYITCSYCATRNKPDAWYCDACGGPTG